MKKLKKVLFIILSAISCIKDYFAISATAILLIFYSYLCLSYRLEAETIQVKNYRQIDSSKQQQKQNYKQSICNNSLPVYQEYVKTVIQDVVYSNSKYEISIIGNRIYANYYEDDFPQEKQQVIDEIYREIIDDNILIDGQTATKSKVTNLIKQQNELSITNTELKRIIQSYKERLTERVKEAADKDVESLYNQYEIFTKARKEHPSSYVDSYDAVFEYKEAICDVFIKLKNNSSTYKLYNKLPLSKNEKKRILESFNIKSLMYGPYDGDDELLDKFYENIVPDMADDALRAHFSEVYSIITEGSNSSFYKRTLER